MRELKERKHSNVLYITIHRFLQNMGHIVKSPSSLLQKEGCPFKRGTVGSYVFAQIEGTYLPSANTPKSKCGTLTKHRVRKTISHLLEFTPWGYISVKLPSQSVKILPQLKWTPFLSRVTTEST